MVVHHHLVFGYDINFGEELKMPATKEDTLRKVRALLAKAEAEGVTPPEAEALTAKAAELMARYGIDAAMAAVRGNVRATPTNKVFDISAPYAQPKAHLLHVVAKALHCESITLGTRGPDDRVHIFGFESDIQQVEMLYTSLLLQMSHATARHPIPRGLVGRQIMAERRSYMLGFSSGVKPRLEEAYARAVAETDDSGTVGKEVVLASRDVAVRAALESEYSNIRTRRTTYRGNGFGAGHAKGQNANIHNRPSATGSSRAGIAR
jgi:hypothetical protein